MHACRLLAAALLSLLPASPALSQGPKEAAALEGSRRVAPALRPRLTTTGEQSTAGCRIRLRYREGVPEASVRALLERLGGSELRALPEVRRFAARLAVNRISALAADRGIEWIEEEPAEDLDRDENDGLRRAIGYDQLQPWPPFLRGQGIRIAAWEAGHPDVDTASGLYPGHDDISGRVEVMESSLPSGHATAVAAVIAGDGMGSELWGGEPYQWQGLAPRARILSYSTIDSDEEAAEMMAAIRDQHIDIALHSWGELITESRCDVLGDYTLRSAEFDQAIAGDSPVWAGEGRVPVVFSVGNYQNLLGCPIRGGGADVVPGFWSVNPPHTAKNIIAVGAIYSDDLGMTVFSSWGPTDDGRLKPDLVAPGSERGGDYGILSAVFDPPDGYRADEGTSYSAATVAGMLAMLIGEREQRGAATLPPAAWKALLIQSAVDLTSDPRPVANDDPVARQEAATRYQGPDYLYGYGLPLLPNALRLSLSQGSLREGTVSAREEQRYALTFPADAAKVRVTLVWDDPAGDPGASRALINDLDLMVLQELEGGLIKTAHPWKLDPDRPDLPASRGIDRLNNVEQVELEAMPGARLTVVVTGAGVPLGPQRFWVAICEACTLAPDGRVPFRRGDVTDDGEVDIADPIGILGFLFQGKSLPCLDGADANDDGRVDIADGIRLLNYLFLEVPPGAAPLGGECSPDPTLDSLGCAMTSQCGE